MPGADDAGDGAAVGDGVGAGAAVWAMVSVVWGAAGAVGEGDADMGVRVGL